MTPRFVADCMLGRLARWLRAFGFDVVYHPFAEDQQLVRWARQTSAILITRDTRLANTVGPGSEFTLSLSKGTPPPPLVGRACLRPPPVILIRRDQVEDQLYQVVTEARIDLSQAHPLTRCTLCNQPLRPAEKEEVRRRLPPYLLATQQVFALCPGCGRIYWHGTHAARIRERLAQLVARSLRDRPGGPAGPDTELAR